uniref:Uncharacterized protein n=1 Tax=Moniliophthora roreri TaxID=221103 RepID=A0A0W0EYE7_MONRR
MALRLYFVAFIALWKRTADYATRKIYELYKLKSWGENLAPRSCF